MDLCFVKKKKILQLLVISLANVERTAGWTNYVDILLP